jgi:high-affinity Fe2+/Pb2+ permease
MGIQLVGLFFYWPNARKPLIWLIGLVGVIAISAVFGAVVQFILNRINGRRFQANLQ